MMKRDLNIGAVLAMTLVLLLSVNLIGAIAFRHVKLDLTEDSLFTLSKGSKAMLSKLDEKVTLKLFYSKRSAGAAPVIKAYAERTIQLLQEFASHSKGLVVVEVIDPRPDTEEEEWAIKYGIRPIQGDSEPIYFGLAAINETGTERSVPFLDPNREGFLEYDIASIIVAISHSDRKTIGVLSPLNIMGGNDP
ncbi:GldG family protein, partial [Candidatus Sumerlaeota bacterium]|nr:GldG family protein [Candidatus Sumerlaeota bacterium]